jgi:hypothetical protein
MVLSLAAGETSATPAEALPQATAVTDIDESSLSCDVSGTPELSQGITVVTCTAKDLNSDKTGSCSYNVVVKDTTPPVFNSCPPDSSVPTVAGQSYGLIDWDATLLLAADAFDGVDVTPVCNAVRGVTQAELGVFEVICSATDQAGNVERCLFAVVVEDEEAPDMTCQATSVKLGSASAVVLSAEEWPVSVMDNSGVAVAAVCTPSADTAFEAGNTVVSCTATDSAGNEDDCSFTVQVQIDCVPEWGSFGACSACPAPFKTRMLASEQIPAE